MLFFSAERARWVVDEPAPLEWFDRARPLSWTHDPFDRLIVAHALHRGWKLASADAAILDNVDARHVLAL